MANIQSVATSNGGLSLTGFSSNPLDTSKLIEGLTAIQTAQINRLQAKKDVLSKKQEALATLQSKLQAVQSAANKLGTTFSSVFDNREVSSSNSSIATAAAGSGAKPGNFSFSVDQLALTEQRASQAFAATDASIATGTLILQQGSGAATTITIDSTNNTLAGLAEAINGSQSDVTASIVRTSSGATPYQLILSGKSTGAANALTITNNLSGGSGTVPDLTTTIQSAEDAEVVIGSGGGAITVTSDSNTLQELVPGLTIQLQSAAPGQTVTMTVTNDTAGVKGAIGDLLNAYNDAAQFIEDNSKYNASTNQGGVLFADSSVDSIQNRLRALLGSSISGAPSASAQLASIGISFDSSGQIKVDETRLDSALAGNIPGIDFAGLRRLFVLDGKSNSASLNLLYAPGEISAINSPVTVHITQAATQGAATAASALAASTVIDGTNNGFSLSVDGQGTGQVTLAAGTYSRAALATAIEAAINGSSLLGGSRVQVSVDGSNRLVITSRQYGSSSGISGFSGIGAATLGFDGSESGAGLDVAGSFTYQGVTETATGVGQILRAPATNVYTPTLEVLVTLTSAGMSGTDLELRLTSGIASQLSQYLSTASDTFGSILARGEAGIEDSISGLDDRISQLQTRLTKQKDDLTKRFAAMDALLSQLQSTQDLIKQTLESLTNKNS